MPVLVFPARSAAKGARQLQQPQGSGGQQKRAFNLARMRSSKQGFSQGSGQQTGSGAGQQTGSGAGSQQTGAGAGSGQQTGSGAGSQQTGAGAGSGQQTGAGSGQQTGSGAGQAGSQQAPRRRASNPKPASASGAQTTVLAANKAKTSNERISQLFQLESNSRQPPTAEANCAKFNFQGQCVNRVAFSMPNRRESA
ncbi:MAG: hypothetical protein AAGD07_07615 [Planctomycetota bacterium]